MKREPDIKAPDGYVLGGMRLVRKDGTILFNRGWWKAPDEWIGATVWVHEFIAARSFGSNTNRNRIMLQAAPPDFGLYNNSYGTQQWFSAPKHERNVLCERTDRPDARRA